MIQNMKEHFIIYHDRNKQKQQVQYKRISINYSLINEVNNYLSTHQQMEHSQQTNQTKSKQTSKQPNTIEFIKKYQTDLSKEFLTQTEKQINIIILKQQEIQLAAKQIQANRLVAFPTQTVYGLGANALSQSALLDIYKVKKRPLSDPIIVHVLNYQAAQKFVIINENQRQLVKALSDKFWPGPLTIIFKANLQILPKVVTANTGFVGIRSPKHPYARKLLQYSKLPIGAPSANLFAHVSPTSPVHVFNDFYSNNITLIDGERCEFGIESTVVKIVGDQKLQIQILRQGSLSVSKFKQFFEEIYKQNPQKIPKISIKAKTKHVEQNQNMQSPGQLLKHYSPYLPCYYLSQSLLKKPEQLPFKLQNSAIIAFQDFNQLKDKCKYYFDCKENQFKDEVKQLNQESQTFCTKQQQQLMKSLYFLLRKCENLQIECIILGWSQQKAGSIWDKIFRATEGKSFNK